MKTLLMFENEDFTARLKFPSNESDLMQDLELKTLCNAMSKEDDFLFDVARKALLSGLYNDEATILYRQAILKDCLKNPSTITSIYNLTIEAIAARKKHMYGIFMRYPSSILSDSTSLLSIMLDMLKQLRTLAEENADKFESYGFTRFFVMLKNEFNDEYIAKAKDHLSELKFPNGLLISTKLDKYNKGENYILRKLAKSKEGWFKRLFIKKAKEFTFNIHPRDESGLDALSELRDRGINTVSNSLAQSTDHILMFFNMLRTELAFYISCLNLHEQLTQIQMPMCFPFITASDDRNHDFKELYDVCLALKMNQHIVGNTIDADYKNLVIVTGANQGGKSTFLRSIGLSQLMMQCGMFVPAESFCANLCNAVFTHYKREEDVDMKSGKLDEELKRMSDIVDEISENSLLLLNESFAATNEREGSEIAKQIVTALIERHVKIFFVTHLFEFAHTLYNKRLKYAIFLRAERCMDGKRTFKILESEPLQTSYGVDLYNRVFHIKFNHSL